jgi:hypothetical protein
VQVIGKHADGQGLEGVPRLDLGIARAQALDLADQQVTAAVCQGDGEE